MSERKQLELNLDAKRPRARLLGDESTKMDGAIVTMSQRGMEMFIGYSPWVHLAEMKPPCSGGWDLRQSPEHEPLRCQYNAETDTWSGENWPFPKKLEGVWSWRGLCRPWEDFQPAPTRGGPQKRLRAVLLED